MTQTLITPAYEKAGGGSAVARANRISHPNVELLADMTVAQRNAVFRYLARFPDLDDAKIFYAFGILTSWLVRMPNAVSTQLWRSLHN